MLIHLGVPRVLTSGGQPSALQVGCPELTFHLSSAARAPQCSSSLQRCSCWRGTGVLNIAAVAYVLNSRSLLCLCSLLLLSVQGAEVLAALVKQAAGRISIMAGGGVTASNAAELQALGVSELHSSAKR